MDSQLIHRIAKAYQLDVIRIFPPQKGYRNSSFAIELISGQFVNFIFYKSEPGILDKIKNANFVANTLAKSNFPARHTVSNKIIQLKGSKQQRYGALYAYLPGHTIPWEGYTRQHIKLLGHTMGEMHELLTPYAVTARVVDEYAATLQRMRRYFNDPAVRRALQQKLHLSLEGNFDTFEKALRASELLPQQALHMDFVRGNILFTGANKATLRISGVLDFEKTATGPRIFDIARTLAFLLVDCKYHSEESIHKAFLHSGYIKRGGAQFKTIRYKDFDLLEELISLFLMYDFYKFLRHNPYESLEQNEHFIRTRTLLQKRQHLTLGKE